MNSFKLSLLLVAFSVAGISSAHAAGDPTLTLRYGQSVDASNTGETDTGDSGTGGTDAGGTGTGGTDTGDSGTGGAGPELDPNIPVLSPDEAGQLIDDGTYVDNEEMGVFDCTYFDPEVDSPWSPELATLEEGTHQQTQTIRTGSQCSFVPVIENVETGEKAYVDFVYVEEEPYYEYEDVTRMVTVSTQVADIEENEWLPAIADQKTSFLQSRIVGNTSGVTEYIATSGGQEIEVWFKSSDEETTIEERNVHYHEMVDESSLTPESLDLAKATVSSKNDSNYDIIQVNHPVGSDEYNYAWALNVGTSNFDGRKATTADLLLEIPNVSGYNSGYYYTGAKANDDSQFAYNLNQDPSMVVGQVDNIPYTGTVDILLEMDIEYINYVEFNEDGSIDGVLGDFDRAIFSYEAARFLSSGQLAPVSNRSTFNKTFYYMFSIEYRPI